MSLSGNYGQADDTESLALLKTIADSGCTFWDTAAVYGMGHNEQLLGRFFKENPGYREKIFVGSKCGWKVSGFLPIRVMSGPHEDWVNDYWPLVCHYLSSYYIRTPLCLSTISSLYTNDSVLISSWAAGFMTGLPRSPADTS
jgi:aryl-alcohol dehydrogenase-like predicted oxidoreductase